MTVSVAPAARVSRPDILVTLPEVTAADASIPPVVVDTGVTTVPPTAVTVSVATMMLVTTAVACRFEVSTWSSAHGAIEMSTSPTSVTSAVLLLCTLSLEIVNLTALLPQAGAPVSDIFNVPLPSLLPSPPQGKGPVQPRR